jgi:hypothetical protein
MSKLLKRAGASWDRFWFVPQSTSTLALFRIAFGLIAFFWTLSLIPNLYAFFGPDGIMPTYPDDGAGAWGVLEISNSTTLLVAVLLVTLMASAALTMGLYTRVAAVLVWLGIMAFQHRNPLIGNSGDALIGNLALFLALAPSGVALSVDRLRKAPGRFWEFPARAPWALRLVQIQLSFVYISAVWQKMQGQMWRDGTAVSYALRIADVGRVPTPEFITNSVVLSEMMTFGTLALELSLGILIWNRVARPCVLAAGVVMHLGIDFSILVGFFSFTMIAAYISFVPADTATRRILAVRDWVVERRNRRGAGASGVLAANPEADNSEADNSEVGHSEAGSSGSGSAEVGGGASDPGQRDVVPETGAPSIPVQTVRELIGAGGVTGDAATGAGATTAGPASPEQAPEPLPDNTSAPSWADLVADRRHSVNGAESRSGAG